MDKYTITKILSNNVVLVENKQKKFVFVGKGLGFGRKRGDVLENLQEIEQKFISLEGLKNNNYEVFFETVDPQIIEVCKKIDEMTATELGQNFSASINIGLIDHISFAIKRLREGIEIVNPFLFETKLLYPVEYEFAQKAVKILEQDLDISIPEAEIGFLTLHFYGGRGSNDKMKAMENTRLLNQLMDFVEKKLQVRLEKNSFDYKRLMIHLSGVIKRAETKHLLKDSIALKLKEELPFEYKLAYDISRIIGNTLKLSIPEAELIYTALHLHKIRLNSEGCSTHAEL